MVKAGMSAVVVGVTKREIQSEGGGDGIWNGDGRNSYSEEIIVVLMEIVVETLPSEWYKMKLGNDGVVVTVVRDCTGDGMRW